MLSVALAAACGANAPAGANAIGNSGGAMVATVSSYSAADLAFCVSETNRYRALVKLGPLTRSSALESYAAAGALADQRARTTHLHASQTPLAGAFGENEIPWASTSSVATVQELITQGLAAMWGEGPTGPHYANIVGPWTRMGCGIFIEGGAMTVVQDFQ